MKGEKVCCETEEENGFFDKAPSTSRGAMPNDAFKAQIGLPGMQSSPGVKHNPHAQARVAAQRQANLMHNMPASTKSTYELMREQAYPTPVEKPAPEPMTAARRIAAEDAWSTALRPYLAARRKAKLDELRSDWRKCQQEEQMAQAAMSYFTVGKAQERMDLSPMSSLPRMNEKPTARSRFAAAYQAGLAC